MQKPRIKMIIGFIIFVALAIGMTIAVSSVFISDFGNLGIFLSVVTAILMLYSATRLGNIFTCVVFDENGFTFYDILGKIDFCPWESIERAEHYYAKRDYFDIGYRSGPVDQALRSLILVYTQERYFTPEINENYKITNRDRKGRRLRMNARKSFVAWVFTYSDAKKLTEYLEKYRPDLFIERHKSAI